jgi:hypothetical protein
MTIYDAFELHPIALYADCDGTHEDRASNPATADYWSLFGHLPTGGVECLADFKTSEAARLVFARLKAADQLQAERAELLAGLRSALSALNLAPRHRRGGVDTYQIAAEVQALLHRLGRN